MTRMLLLFALSLGLTGCDGERPRFRGEGCDLNTECDPPLVCGFRRCRIECRSEVDCGLGLACFLDSSGLGYCQLPDELECLLDSDCEEACGGDTACRDRLACRDGECGQECVTDRDCAEGSTCEASTDGVHTCEPAAEELCVYNSDCDDPTHVCDARQVCRVECRTDPDPTRDCVTPRVCALVPIMVEETMTTIDAPRCVLPADGRM